MTESRVADKPVETLVGGHVEQADDARVGVHPIIKVIDTCLLRGLVGLLVTASGARPRWRCGSASSRSSPASALPAERWEPRRHGGDVRGPTWSREASCRLSCRSSSSAWPTSCWPSSTLVASAGGLSTDTEGDRVVHRAAPSSPRRGPPPLPRQRCGPKTPPRGRRRGGNDALLLGSRGGRIAGGLGAARCWCAIACAARARSSGGNWSTAFERGQTQVTSSLMWNRMLAAFSRKASSSNRRDMPWGPAARTCSTKVRVSSRRSASGPPKLHELPLLHLRRLAHRLGSPVDRDECRPEEHSVTTVGGRRGRRSPEAAGRPAARRGRPSSASREPAGRAARSMRRPRRGIVVRPLAHGHRAEQCAAGEDQFQPHESCRGTRGLALLPQLCGHATGNGQDGTQNSRHQRHYVHCAVVPSAARRR